MRAKFDGFRF